MAGVVRYIDSFEHGIGSTTGNVYVLTVGTNWETASPIHGSRSLKYSGGLPSIRTTDLVTTSQLNVARVYVRADALSAVNDLFLLRMYDAANTVRVELKINTSGQFALVDNLGGGVTGPTLTAGVVYRVDLKLNWSANPWLTDWQVATGDGTGTAQTQLSTANAATALRYFGVGYNGSASGGWTAVLDSPVVTNGDLTDYPLPAGQVKAYSTAAVGTHNLDAATSTFFFKDDNTTETALTTSETTSYQMLDEQPVDGGVDRVEIHSTAPTSNYIDPNGNGASTAWTGDFTGIDDGVRQPTSPGTGDSISTSTVSALEDQTWPDTLTWSATDTYTLWVNAQTNAATKRKIQYAISTNDGTSFGTLADLMLNNVAQSWVSVDVTASIVSQATLNGFRTRFSMATTGGGSSGTVNVYAVYLEQTIPGSQPANTYYAEHTFSPGLSAAPRAVRVVHALKQDTAGTAPITAKVNDGTSDATVYSALAINSTAFVFRQLTEDQAPSAVTWTAALANGLKNRWGFTADATGVPRLEAVLIETFEPSTGTAQALAAAPAAVSTLAANMTLAEALRAAPAGTSTAVAALSLALVLQAAAAAVSTSTAALGLGLPLQAAPAASSTSTAALTVTKSMAAAPAGVSTLTAVLDVAHQLLASPAAVSTAAGALTVAHKLLAAPAAASSATATLTTVGQVAFAATPAAASTLTAALTVAHALVASPAALSTLAATLTLNPNALAAAVAAVSTGSASLTVTSPSSAATGQVDETFLHFIRPQ